MKRRIAVFTNGWSDDYLDFALEGIRRRAAESNVDVFIFMDYTSYDKAEADIQGELNILNLPDLSDFDGVLLLGNTLNNAGENEILRQKILAANVRAVCLECQLEDINCIRTENLQGMRELVEHMVTVHDVKDVFWVSGPPDNEDNNERYKVVADTLGKYGISVDPSRTFNGSWSYAIVVDNFPKVLSQMEKLPDVFICANDSMALAVCIVLDQAGYKVPDDVKVTGFDNLMSGNHFSPILTSVDRGWEERTYQATDSLIGLINGEPDFIDKVYNSRVHPGESCGCSMGEEGVRIQSEARKRAFLVPVERTIFDWHLIELDRGLASVKSLDAIHPALSAMWEKSHIYEGDDFFVCLDQDYIASTEQDMTCRTVGYSQKIEMVYGMQNGVTVPQQTIFAKDLVPYYDPDSSESVVYLFAPLHIDAECFGYYVSKNNVKPVKDFYINSLIGHIVTSLERARQNIKLEALNKRLAYISERDELTGLYNRMGYEKIAIPYLDELRRTKLNPVIMVVDINRMKVINDQYGHLQGDTAIKLVAQVILSCIPKNWKAVRYGGDEYVIIGEYQASDKVESIKKEIIDQVEAQSEKMKLPFKISVSVGHVLIDPNGNLENEEYFRMADEAMYEMKVEAHKQDQNPS